MLRTTKSGANYVCIDTPQSAPVVTIAAAASSLPGPSLKRVMLDNTDSLSEFAPSPPSSVSNKVRKLSATNQLRKKLKQEKKSHELVKAEKEKLEGTLRDLQLSIARADQSLSDERAKCSKIAILGMALIDYWRRDSLNKQDLVDRLEAKLKVLWEENTRVPCMVCHEEHALHLFHPQVNPNEAQHAICSACLDGMTRAFVERQQFRTREMLCPLCNVPKRLVHNHNMQTLFEASRPTLVDQSSNQPMATTANQLIERMVMLGMSSRQNGAESPVRTEPACMTRSLIDSICEADCQINEASVRQLLYPNEQGPIQNTRDVVLSSGGHHLATPEPPNTPSLPVFRRFSRGGFVGRRNLNQEL
jgi:uncharacterized CHY-type Zn-finger protein